MLLVVGLVSIFFGLLELKDKMAEWDSQFVHMLMQFLGHGHKDHASYLVTTSKSIAEEVMNKAKNIITGAATTAAGSNGTAEVAEAHVPFSFKICLKRSLNQLSSSSYW